MENRGLTPIPEIDSGSRPAGLRAVALFEAAKGALVLMAGFGLFRLLHRDAEHAADLLSRRLHLNPAKEHAKIFVDLLADLSSGRLWMLAALALAYSSVRFIEASGLWHNRGWAKWFAALSGGIYVPFELYELYLGASWLKLAALVLNLAVVAYMVHSIRSGTALAPPRA
jgi:uncharacterized membrane protein (DUF2068 family)